MTVGGVGMTTNSNCAGPALRHQVGTASSQLSLYGGGILVTDAFTVKFDRKTGENNLWQKRGVN